LQRAYDQMLYDVAMDGLDVTFMIDRAGIVGEDGESHQGIYDLNLLSTVPNIMIASPASDLELEKMLVWAKDRKGVKAIRYPKGSAETCVQSDDCFPKWKVLRFGEEGYLLAHGARMVSEALEASRILETKGRKIGVVNARFVAPLDEDFLLTAKDLPLYVAEDVVYAGSLAEELAAKGYRVTPFTLPNTFVTFGRPSELRVAYAIDAQSIAERIIHET